jgi:hypothetical protein
MFYVISRFFLVTLLEIKIEKEEFYFHAVYIYINNLFLCPDILN